MRRLLPIALAALCGCGSGDPPPVVGKDAPGTEEVAKALDSPETQAKLAARNASRGASRVTRPDRSR